MFYLTRIKYTKSFAKFKRFCVAVVARVSIPALSQGSNMDAGGTPAMQIRKFSMFFANSRASQVVGVRLAGPFLFG